MRALEIDPWTRDILWQVCHAGPYSSSVLLSIDLADLGKISSVDHAVGLVEAALQSLNEHGLVVYVETSRDRWAHGRPPLTRIRATSDAFEAMGFPPEVRVVGPKHSLGSQRATRPGDPTDWRNHGPHAVGASEIERLPLREHMERYWDHARVHFEALREIEAEQLVIPIRPGSD